MTESCDAHCQGSLQVCILASGSKGNAIYIGNGRTAVLVDAGLSGIELERRMRSAGLDVNSLKAIIVSHEHSDHTRGIGVLSRRFDLPVYCSAGTRLAAEEAFGRIKNLNCFEVGRPFGVEGFDDLVIHPFATSHDANDPSGFTLARNGCKIGIATDLGIATGMVKQHLKACCLLILEANHDPRMLAEGPYPWPLKQRIKSRNGHLSNEESRDLLGELLHENLDHVILAHLSETNNTPEKALEAAHQALTARRHRAALHVACQERCSHVLVLK